MDAGFYQKLSRLSGCRCYCLPVKFVLWKMLSRKPHRREISHLFEKEDWGRLNLKHRYFRKRMTSIRRLRDAIRRPVHPEVQLHDVDVRESGANSNDCIGNRNDHTWKAFHLKKMFHLFPLSSAYKPHARMPLSRGQIKILSQHFLHFIF